MAGIIANMTGMALAGLWGLTPQATARPHFANRPRIYAAETMKGEGFFPIWAALGHHARRLSRPVLTEESWQQKPLRAWWMRDVFHTLALPTRGAYEPSVARHIAAPLEAGEHLIIFIEALRSPKGSLLHAVLTMVPDVEVVPISLEPRRRLGLPHWSLRFGTPLELGMVEENDDFITRLTQEIRKLRKG